VSEFEEVVKSGLLTQEEREVIALLRDELAVRGILDEPLRSKIAYEFAESILARRGRKDGTYVA